MKEATSRIAAILLILLTGSALVLFISADNGTPTARESAGGSSPMYQEGQGRYIDECSSCHGVAADGNGAWSSRFIPVPANLTLVEDSESMMLSVVLNGVPGTEMPAHPQMSREIVKAIDKYIENQPESRQKQWEAIPELNARQSEIDAQAGYAHYMTACVGCHGEGGNTPTAFAQNKYVWPKPANLTARSSKPERLYYIISNGREGTFMPAQKNKLPEVARVALVHYVETLFDKNSKAEIEVPDSQIPQLKNPYTTDNKDVVDRGQTLYKFYCDHCHGGDAGGDFHAPSLIDREWLFGGGTDTAIFTIISEGVPGKLMPAMKHLPEDDRWKIITFFRSKGGLPSPQLLESGSSEKNQSGGGNGGVK